MRFTLRARWILPVDRSPLHGGYVGVDGASIVAVGNADPQLGPVTDLGDVVLMPGLVNAHTHLEFSRLEAPLANPGVGLPSWIRQVIADRGRRDRDAAAALAAGLKESLVAGVTTLGEIATAPFVDYPPAHEPQPFAVYLLEAIGFSTGRIDSVFADLRRRLDAAQSRRVGLSPHAPYTVHPQLLERIVGLAAERAVPVAMHLAESAEELELLATGEGEFRTLLEERSMWDATAIPHGARPLDYLRVLARAPRSLVIHGNYLAADEIDYVGAHADRMSVVYCPRTHAYFQHSRYPLEELLAAGARVALGTDSRASTPDLSLLGEVQAAAAEFPAIEPATFLRMATLDAAQALGLSDQAGSLTPGKRADLIALPCSAGDDPFAAILAAERPEGVWLAGERLVARAAP